MGIPCGIKNSARKLGLKAAPSIRTRFKYAGIFRQNLGIIDNWSTPMYKTFSQLNLTK